MRPSAGRYSISIWERRSTNNELLIRFYSQIGKDPGLLWRKTCIYNIKGNKVPEK